MCFWEPEGADIITGALSPNQNPNQGQPVLLSFLYKQQTMDLHGLHLFHGSDVEFNLPFVFFLLRRLNKYA